MWFTSLQTDGHAADVFDSIPLMMNSFDVWLPLTSLCAMRWTLNQNLQPIYYCVLLRSPKCSIAAELAVVHWAQYKNKRSRVEFGCQNQEQEVREMR